MTKWIVSAAILLALVVPAWVVYLRPPQDLRVTSLRVIHWSEVPAKDEAGNVPEPGKLLAVIGFRSSTDLAKFGYNIWYSGLYVHASNCRTGQTISEGFNLIYDEGGGRTGFGETPAAVRTGNYHLYVALKSSVIPQFSTYDLIKAPDDICVALVPEAPNWGPGAPTNVMRISKSDIAKALAHMGA